MYSKHLSDEFKGLAAQLIKKLKLDSEKSKNYLHAYLEAPGVIGVVYKIARLFVVRNSHICLVGLPRAGGREYLQLACLVYPNTVLYEPAVRITGDIVAFRKAFKSAMLLAVRFDKDVVFYYDVNHLD